MNIYIYSSETTTILYYNFHQSRFYTIYPNIDNGYVEYNRYSKSSERSNKNYKIRK